MTQVLRFADRDVTGARELRIQDMRAWRLSRRCSLHRYLRHARRRRDADTRLALWWARLAGLRTV
jgi:hypothetical protein